ncbi:MAG: hypothetical protein M3Y50_03300 [Acidobacteriota bacterium]|nr:hypothetical protein [Acidobacteriota bacterium]
MTVEAAEPSRLSYWMHRLWPAYWVLAALATFGYAFYDPYQVDGDAVAYMDIGDLIRAHHWAGVVNGYWNPLYPAALAAGQVLFHATRFTELHAYYLVNFGVFLLEMLALVLFIDAVIDLREACTAPEQTAPPALFLLDRCMLRYVGVALLVISAQRELSLGKVRPDALLQALLLFGLAALLKHLATGRMRYAALMGISLGFAYLAKSFAFPFALLCLAALAGFSLLWQKRAGARVVVSTLLAVVCFSFVAGPYIGALSRQKGRFDFGDSGSLNYIWFVSGTEKMHLEPDEPELFGSAEVHLKHPEKQLLKNPGVFSYKLLPYGTYPDWFDASFWNDHMKAHMNPRLEAGILRDCAVRIVRYIANHPEAWLLLVILFLAGGRLAFDRPVSRNIFWILPVLLGLGVLGIYSLVNIEDRYITVGFLAILLPLFASLRLSHAHTSASARALASTSVSAAIVLFALLATGESLRIVGELRRSLPFQHSPAGWYDADTFQAAHALNDLGVGPGDAIACIGTRACLYDHYWARLAGVRILTEIYEPTAPLYPAVEAMPGRDHVYDIVRQQGARVLVGYFDPGRMTGSTPASQAWVRLGESHFYALPLNLPAAATSALPH